MWGKSCIIRNSQVEMMIKKRQLLKAGYRLVSSGGDVRAHYLLGKVKNRALMRGQKGGTL